MPAILSSTGLAIDTQAVAFDTLVDDLATELGLTAEQREEIRRTRRNGLHVLCRLTALRDVAGQEALLEVYRRLSWYAEGSHLESVVALLGVERRAQSTSRLAFTVEGSNGTSIPLGSRWRYEPTGSTWVQTSATVLIAGGTSAVTLESEAPGEPDEVTLSDATWTSLDGIAGVSDAYATEQPIVGAPVETDPQLRARAAIEAYRRGQGPLLAIEAAVAAVDGVTFVRAYENTDETTDADGIPSRAIYVVVDGGAEAGVVAAILASRPAGIYLHGSDHAVVSDLGSGRVITVRYDDVTETPLWIRATIETSTSEELAAGDVTTQCEALLLERALALATIGGDVLPRKLAGALDDVNGFDGVDIELSDDGVIWLAAGAKWPIGINERPLFAAARVSCVEA